RAKHAEPAPWIGMRAMKTGLKRGKVKKQSTSRTCWRLTSSQTCCGSGNTMRRSGVFGLSAQISVVKDCLYNLTGFGSVGKGSLHYATKSLILFSAKHTSQL